MPVNLLEPLLWSAPRSSYIQGETIVRSLKAIDGTDIGQISFKINHSPGSGFAGQVYQAFPQHFAGLPAAVAIKVLRPRSRGKLWLRDALFKFGFQTSYAPRLRKEAVQAGLIWQTILRTAVEIELGSMDYVTQPFGYFWDADIASFAEVHEWIDGRPARNEPDELLFARLFQDGHPPTQSEMTRKKLFMDTLANLCRQIGAPGMARQFEWWTLVSQDNVLTRLSHKPNEVDHKQSGEPHESYRRFSDDFCAVDCQPGLAVPFLAPITPAHLRIIIEGLQRGVLVHFDEVDLHQLQVYLSQHSLPDQIQTLVTHLQKIEPIYRNSLPNLWHTGSRILSDPAFLTGICTAGVQDFIRCNQISSDYANVLVQTPMLYCAAAITYQLPIFGPFITRLAVHSGYRCHLKRLFTAPSYRQAAFETWRTRDLVEWQSENRITSGHFRILQASTSLFILEKIAISWLPPGLHNLLVEKNRRMILIDTLLFQQIRLLFDRQARAAWLKNILTEQYERGMVTTDLYNIHIGQIQEPRMQGYIRDLGLTASLDVFSRLVYFFLGLYGITTGDFFPLGLAILAPIPPSGPVRVIYLLIQLIQDPGHARLWRQPILRVLEARIAALFIAPWRWIGNLFPLVEISAFYTRLSFLLAEYFISRASEKVPIFGGRGKLLEWAIFHLCYNVPLSLRFEIKRLLRGKGPQ